MMGSHNTFSKQAFIFRTYKPYTIISITLAAISLLFFLVLALVTQNSLCLLPVAFMVGILLYCIRYYRVHAIIVRGATLTLRRGIKNMQEDSILLFRDSPNFQTTLLGAFFGYTTVVIRGANGYVGLTRIANAEQLRQLIAIIQMAAPHLVDDQNLGHHSYLVSRPRRRQP